MVLNPENLRQRLWQFPAADQIKTWWLAYSGGVDSQVLLHLLSRIKGLNVRAVYIDHGLHPASQDWSQHCAISCQQLNIPFQSISVNARAEPGESPEAAARHARYQQLATLIGQEDCLLTAQHEDDQAETLLLQLIRGAGAAGLAAMPTVTRFSRGWHLRPLLGFSRQEILDYAQVQQLNWIEDPSNQDDCYDRNFLRHRITPLLKQRWPSISHSLSRAAELQAENARLLESLAELDAKGVETPQQSLAIAPLLVLDDMRQRNVLRHWIQQQGFGLPSRAIMAQIQQQMLHSREDACPRVSWSQAEMHRYQGQLYLLPAQQHDSHQVLQWDVNQPLALPSLQQHLELQPMAGQGIAAAHLDTTLTVRFRTGGETIKPAGRKQTHSLKKLLQEAGVPPWLRSRIPLLYRQDTLIAVVGYWIAEGYQVTADKTGQVPVLSALDRF